MTGLLQQAKDLLSQMNDAEKTQLLQWVVRDLHGEFPGIESTPGVCGGEPCIARSRIPVWAIECARQLGATDAVLLESYPTLRSEDLERAAANVRLHREDIERQIRENEDAATILTDAVSAELGGEWAGVDAIYRPAPGTSPTVPNPSEKTVTVDEREGTESSDKGQGFARDSGPPHPCPSPPAKPGGRGECGADPLSETASRRCPPTARNDLPEASS